MAASAVTATVLIVEDDQDTCDAMSRLLRRHGFDAECAGTIGQAMVRLEQGPVPDFIVLDMKLPDANGGVLLRYVRRNNLALKVVVVTGASEPWILSDLQKFPPDHVLTKPVQLPELVAWLNAAR